MKAKLIVEGKELEVEISEEELKKLKEKKLYKTGYEKVPEGQDYYYATDGGDAEDYKEEWDYEVTEVAYEGANYYSDKTVAVNNARADKLMRQLRRFSVENRKEVVDYNDSVYEIYYDYDYNKLDINYVSICKYIGAIPFDTYTTAKLAIDTFRDELIWYFTEYKDSL